MVKIGHSLQWDIVAQQRNICNTTNDVIHSRISYAGL